MISDFKVLKSLIIFILRSSLTFCNAQDKNPSVSSPYDFSAIDKLMSDSVSKIYHGNAVVMITVDGRVVYSRGFGSFNENTRRPIASNSKYLSGAVIMSLVDENKLSLNDTVGKYLPIFTKYGKGNITIRQLFSHTSGFPGNSPQRYELLKFRNASLAAIADSIAINVPLSYKPGTVFEYGGVGMQVAGRIAEVVSGKLWEDLFREKIGSPCGMSTTNYGNGPNPSIAGGVRSTTREYTNFLMMMVNNGIYNGKRVLSENAVREMEKNQSGNVTTSHSPYPNHPPFNPYKNDTIRYGIGCWRDVVLPNGEAEEVSCPGLFGSHPWIDPKKKLTGYIFTFLINGERAGTGKTALKVRSIVRNVVPDVL